MNLHRASSLVVATDSTRGTLMSYMLVSIFGGHKKPGMAGLLTSVAYKKHTAGEHVITANSCFLHGSAPQRRPGCGPPVWRGTGRYLPQE